MFRTFSGLHDSNFWWSAEDLRNSNSIFMNLINIIMWDFMWKPMETNSKYYICSSVCCPVPSPDLSFQPDEHLEVYVSAYENPNHFWIQILGVRSLQLDKLTEEMNHFYNNSSSTVRMTPVSLSVSGLVFTTTHSLAFRHVPSFQSSKFIDHIDFRILFWF